MIAPRFCRTLTRLCLVVCAALGDISVLRAAEPWQGAAFEGDPAALQKLAAAGAKVVRVYRESDAWVLDAAQGLGLKVVMGLWVEHPRHGFRLDDPVSVRAQETNLRNFVLQYRTHPALLAWGIGNEVETGVADPGPVWREIDRLAGVVKLLDPAHPTLMVVPDGNGETFRRLADCCANVDLLGVNVYAGAINTLAERARAAGITKPIVVTELGPLGQWQAGRKPWGAPVEPTSTEKARFFRDALKVLRQDAQIVGVFPFLWGAKQEQTATWHGLLLADGSETAMTDALATEWGRPPATRAPEIRGIGIAADTFTPGQLVTAGVDAASFDGSALSTEWQVFAEASDLREGGDHEAPPERIPVTVTRADASSVSFHAPLRSGAYRLFITVRDVRGKVGTANLPFFVR